MLYLEVPFPDNPAVKALGARFDPACKKWYVPDHLDPASFDRWLPRSPSAPAGATIPVRVVLLPESCWRCHTPIRPVLGVELPAPTEAHPDGFVGIDLCAETVAATVPAEELLDAGAGAIRWRTTRVMSDGYWANTCPSCDATIGSFPLVHEALPELAAEGLTPQDLPGLHAEVPAAAFAHNPWDEEDDDDEPMALSEQGQAQAPQPLAPAPSPGPAPREGLAKRLASAFNRVSGRSE
jgi:hypothetical protein